MAVAGADAIRAGVTATDDDDVLAGGHGLRRKLVAGVDLVLLRQKLHGEVHAVELAPRHRQVARQLGAAGDDDGVEFSPQLFRRDARLAVIADNGGQRVLAGAFANEHAGAKLDALGLHLLDAAVDVRFFHLEVGNAVAQETADAVVLFEHHDIVADARELLRGGKAGGTGADDGDFPAGLVARGLRQHPAVLPGLVDDGVLDRLDADGVVVDVERTGRFARRRADAAGELGEVVGRVQRVDGVLPVLPEHHVVEVGNDVVDRAAGGAERNAAIHAARALHLGLFVGKVDDELVVVFFARDGFFGRFVQPLVFEESGYFAHVLCLIIRLVVSRDQA